MTLISMKLLFDFRHILILFLLVALQRSYSDKFRVNQCIRHYALELAHLVKEDGAKVLAQFNKSETITVHRHGGISIYHIGPLQLNLEFELAISQLNITSNVDGKVSAHCHTSLDADKVMNAATSVVYFGNIAVLSSLQHNFDVDSVRFVFSDIDVADVETEMKTTGDCSDSKRRDCLVPIPFVVDESTPILAAAISTTNKDIVKTTWQLYKNMIECIVPSRNLLILNSSITSNSTRYWSTLIKFMNLSSDSASGNINSIPQRTLNSLIKAGVPTMRNGRSCYMNGHVCMYTKINGKSVIVPSVCSLAENIDLVHVTHPRVFSCAHRYVNNLTTLFGERYRKVLLDKLLKPVVMTMYDTPAQIILNIGPGSTGTRSLHMAMRQLNVTASHYRMSTKNCECMLAKDGAFVFEGKQLTLDPERVFWGDTPMVQRWWWYYNYYPESQTFFIMTDADEQKWLSVRLRDHCQNRRIDFDNGCYVPIPMSYFLYNSYHYDSKALSLIQDLAQATHLTKVNNTVSVVGFQYYRDLLHCMIPPEKLLWLDMAKSNNSRVFWNNLVDFLHLDVKPSKLDQLVEAGVPYVGTKGCVINKKPCVYTSFKDKVLPEGKLTSAIIPSVCVD